MSIWLKITLILFGALLISVGVAFIPAANVALPSQPPPSIRQAFQDERLINSLFVRPRQAAVDTCLGSPQHRTLTHGDLVRLAKCLHRKDLVGGQTVAAVERSRMPGSPRQLVSLGAKTTTATWWWLLTWGLALAAIAVVVHHRRRRPPSSGAAAHTGG